MCGHPRLARLCERGGLALGMAGSMRGGDRIDEARGVLLVRIGIERIPALGGVGVTIGGREMPGGRVTGLLRREADRAVGLVPAARALLDVRRREIALARRDRKSTRLNSSH